MITIECPCCADEILMEPDAVELSCAECAVTAQIAPDDRRMELAVAA